MPALGPAAFRNLPLMGAFQSTLPSYRQRVSVVLLSPRNKRPTASTTVMLLSGRKKKRPTRRTSPLRLSIKKKTSFQHREGRAAAVQKLLLSRWRVVGREPVSRACKATAPSSRTYVYEQLS